jgi:hypothetical protein
LSDLPPTRPRNVNAFSPAAPVTPKERRTVTQRVHERFPRFDRFGFTHVPLTLRPATGRSTVKLTLLASERLKETFVPTGLRRALADAPDFAAANELREKVRPPSVGLVWSAAPPPEAWPPAWLQVGEAV